MSKTLQICRLSIIRGENALNTEVPDEVLYEVPDEMSFEVPNEVLYEVPDEVSYEVQNEVPYELHTSTCPRFQVTKIQLYSITLVVGID